MFRRCSLQCLCLIVSSLAVVFVPASAADEALVRLRGGEHETYSRLVFDWVALPGYDVTKTSANTYRIAFDRAAQLDLSALNVSGLAFVKQVKEVSTNPLQVDVTVPAAVQTGAFALGQRVVVDFKTGSVKAKAKSPPEQKTTSSAPVKDVPVSAKSAAADKMVQTNVSAVPPSQEGLSGVRSDLHSDGKAEKEAVEKAGEKPLAEKVRQPSSVSARPLFPVSPEAITIKDTGRQPNFIAISSVSSSAMAAFVVDDRLWLVSNNASALFSPQTSGKQASDLGAPMMLPAQGGQAFVYNALRGAQYLVQGGGLAWRLLIGTDLQPKRKPAQAQRQAVSAHAGRSGQVFWSLPSARSVVAVSDPVTGATYQVVTVDDPLDHSGYERDFIDFRVLRSPLGLAIFPKVDDLIVDVVEGGVLAYRSGGEALALSTQSDIDAGLAARSIERQTGVQHTASSEEDEDKQERLHGTERSLFDFLGWQLGGVEAVSENKAHMLATIPGLTAAGQLEGLMDLARMYVANGMGAEAHGFLEIVGDALPELRTSPEYQALLGVAESLNGHYAEAFRMLSRKELQDRTEVRFWRSYDLAKLYDWQQAARLLPSDLSYLQEYPSEILIPLALTLTEVSLRAGDAARTKTLFDLLHEPRNQAVMRAPHQAALQYLEGEKARQDGQVDEAIRIWGELAEGDDDLYSVRAMLALTRLEREEKNLSLSKAVDRLERLRYAWRGDDLEAQINYWLGRIYFEYGQYVKGLNIMRDSVSYASSEYLGTRIVSDMKEAFEDLFMGSKLYELSGPDVAALYEHFSELVPAGSQGDMMGRRLAGRLVDAHLYDRALEILTYQLNNRLEGEEAYKVAVQMAGIYQLIGQPEKSLELLARSQVLLSQLPDLKNSPKESEAMTLLRANALAHQDDVKVALDLLSGENATPQMNRLRADIAMEHGYWDDAAEALQFMMEDEEILPERPISEQGANIILKRAVALNLGGDRIRLANMREVYLDKMMETERARAFDIVTRIHKTAQLADRDTLLDVVSEIEMFSDFLDAYKKTDEGEGEDAVEGADAVEDDAPAQ